MCCCSFDSLNWWFSEIANCRRSDCIIAGEDVYRRRIPEILRLTTDWITFKDVCSLGRVCRKRIEIFAWERALRMKLFRCLIGGKSNL
ncbi:hypothetical protein CEXT_767071 [Caerostris extrusa]|uniref:Uncharacterized protein n=1 Tax=Caerostris extrusa TaxID=172846 RepID=A0AAV4YAA5_CAEEX|nr:hypothetical protein CEXT_767071 [Caerostris extrusa]